MYWEKVDSTEAFSCIYHRLLFIQSCRGREKNKLEREIFYLNPVVTFHPYLNSEAFDSCSRPHLNVFWFNFPDAILLPSPSPSLTPSFPIIFGGSLKWFSHLFLTLPYFLWVSSTTAMTHQACLHCQCPNQYLWAPHAHLQLSIGHALWGTQSLSTNDIQLVSYQNQQPRTQFAFFSLSYPWHIQ